MGGNNRMTRRHPTHSLLPINYPLRNRIPDDKRKKPCTKPKGSIEKGKRIHY